MCHVSVKIVSVTAVGIYPLTELALVRIGGKLKLIACFKTALELLSPVYMLLLALFQHLLKFFIFII